MADDWNKSTERWVTSLFNDLRKKRVELFIEKLGIQPHHRILDLGSEDGSYLGSYYPHPEMITIADIKKEPMVRGVEKYGLGGYKEIDPDGPLPFEDGEFDAVWCNSVIEHVTVDKGDLENYDDQRFRAESEAHQQEFAREIARVGKAYFVQTPYLHFPIESHSVLPLIHYFGHPTRVWLSRVLKKVWIKQWSADFLLYNFDRFRKDFPDAEEIYKERAFGFLKSVIAIRRTSA